MSFLHGVYRSLWNAFPPSQYIVVNQVNNYLVEAKKENISTNKIIIFPRTSNKALSESEKKLCLKANYINKGVVLENTVKEVNCLFFSRSGWKSRTTLHPMFAIS